jgi:ABC-type nitrate/sulfonate/bicarbonate transport system permease component
MERLLRLSSPLIFLILWEIAARLLVTPLLPSPTQVFLSLIELLPGGKQVEKFGGDLLLHSFESLKRVGGGFILASAIGIPLGITMGWSRKAEHLFDPLIQIFRPIPPIAWIPLAILLFGIGLRMAIFITFLGAFFPILINTIAGVDNVSKIFIEAAVSLGAKRSWEILKKVIFPAALPAMLTGLRVGLGVAWMCVIAAEMVAAKSGLGYLIISARWIHQIDVVVVGMMMIGLIGLAFDQSFRRVERKLLRWMPRLG